nr:hypothetical protein [uncultured Brumimicrobium sp.]
MKLNRLLLLSLGVVLLMACRREGCTDQTAINYDDKAKNDDGSCQYGEATPGGGGSGGSGGTGPGGETLPIRLTGTETSNITIQDQSTNPNVADYYIDGAWRIDADIVIEPGVNIEMRASSYIEVKANGSLSAVGTPSNKINIFGANSNKGFWNYITFESSNNPNNKLIHCNISGGGKSSYRDATVYLKGNSMLAMENSSIDKSALYGLAVASSDSKLASFSNNSFNNCDKEPIYVHNFSQVSIMDNSNSFGLGNAKNRVEVGGGNVDVPTQISNLGVPYFCSGSSRLYSQVEVYEGVKFLMGAGTYIEVNSSAYLNMQGTGSNPIDIRGDVNPNTQGYWKYITFEDSNNPNNVFSNVDIYDGGGSSYRDATVYLKGNSQLRMGGSSINYSARDGLGGSASATYIDNGGNSYSNNVGTDNVYP